jgi:hypothetical protein
VSDPASRSTGLLDGCYLMPRPPQGVDPEAAGSRFTLRPGLAVYGLHDWESAPSAEEAVKEALGEDVLKPLPGLGSGTTFRGSVGRGGEGWAVVIEWVAQPAAAGVIGALAWEATKAGAHAFVSLFEAKRPEGARVLVSRGAAVLIAIDYLLTAESPGELMLDAVDEPTAMAGRESPEANYVDIEPWVVLLVDPLNQMRYVVIVSPSGAIRGHMKTPMEPSELDYR